MKSLLNFKEPLAAAARRTRGGGDGARWVEPEPPQPVPGAPPAQAEAAASRARQGAARGLLEAGVGRGSHRRCVCGWLCHSERVSVSDAHVNSRTRSRCSYSIRPLKPLTRLIGRFGRRKSNSSDEFNEYMSSAIDSMAVAAFSTLKAHDQMSRHKLKPVFRGCSVKR